jgi:transcriptional regulator with XRE-family HTH domain
VSGKALMQPQKTDRMIDEDDILLAEEPDPRARELGERIRSMRRALKLTLAQLAERIGVSIGTLSQTERGLGSPSVRILYDLAAVFSVSPAWLIDPGNAPVKGAENPFIVRASQRRPFVNSNGMLKELVSPTGITKFNGFYVEMEPGASSGDKPYTHLGEEIAYVISGTIELELDDKIYILNVGDCFGFPSTSPHQFRNIGSGRAAVFWVNTRS